MDSPKLAKAVLFDLDGTLVDSLGDLACSANAVLRRHGHPEHPVDAYRHFIGNGARKLVERAVQPSTREEVIDDLLAEYLEVYASNVGASTQAFEGIHELVATLAKNGVPMGVATNKPHDLTLPCLDHCFPGAPFGEAVCGARPDLPAKPAPHSLVEVAQKLLSLCFGGCVAVTNSKQQARNTLSNTRRKFSVSSSSLREEKSSTFPAH